MDLRLKGKTAVITGATRGIGRAMAEMFAAEGASVAICARDPQRIASTTKALESQGVTAFGMAVDAADGAGLKDFVDGAARVLGGIDIVVANASSLTHGSGEENWRAAFEIDMMSAVRLCEAAAPYLEAAGARGDASFLAISSMAATQTASRDAYGAMKAGLIHFTKGAAREYAPKKVRFNAISPGTIYSEDGAWGQAKQHKPDLYNTMISLNPTGRMGTPEEIAAMAVFLSSPLSAFTTGANIVIDGCMGHRVNY